MDDTDKTENAASSYEITMEELLRRLECIRARLSMADGVFLPNNGFMRIQQGDVQSILRFFSLNEVADQWGNQKNGRLGGGVFKALSEFLDKLSRYTDGPLKECWKKNINRNKGTGIYSEQPVEDCMNAVLREEDKKELENQYGINGFPGHGDGEMSPDMSIVSIQALILLWFAALPYTEEATRIRDDYCYMLRGWLKLLLDPMALEFKELSKRAVDSPALCKILRDHIDKHYQNSKDSENDQEYEDIRHKDKSFSKN